MLTENELSWLEQRKNLCNRCFWGTCCQYGKVENDCFHFRMIPSFVDYQDVSIFAGKVIMKLLESLPSETRDELLKRALLEAESELDWDETI